MMILEYFFLINVKKKKLLKMKKIVIGKTNYLANEEFTQQSGIKNSAVI